MRPPVHFFRFSDTLQYVEIRASAIKKSLDRGITGQSWWRSVQAWYGSMFPPIGMHLGRSLWFWRYLWGPIQSRKILLRWMWDVIKHSDQINNGHSADILTDYQNCILTIHLKRSIPMDTVRCIHKCGILTGDCKACMSTSSDGAAAKQLERASKDQKLAWCASCSGKDIPNQFISQVYARWDDTEKTRVQCFYTISKCHFLWLLLCFRIVFFVFHALKKLSR